MCNGKSYIRKDHAAILTVFFFNNSLDPSSLKPIKDNFVLSSTMGCLPNYNTSIHTSQKDYQ
jgi:hypothetical protein